MGVPQNGKNEWFIGEDPNLKWMMNRGTTIYGIPLMEMEHVMERVHPKMVFYENIEGRVFPLEDIRSGLHHDKQYLLEMISMISP